MLITDSQGTGAGAILNMKKNIFLAKSGKEDIETCINDRTYSTDS